MLSRITVVFVEIVETLCKSCSILKFLPRSLVNQKCPKNTR